MKKLIIKYRYDIAIFAVFLVLFCMAFSFKGDFGVLSDRNEFIRFIQGFGIWGPFVIIVTIVLEVVVAPIPGFIPALAAGFIFGPVAGTIYTYIGNMIGTAIVFLLARKFGKPLIAKFVENKKLEKYEHAIMRHENFLLFFYFFPILPIDIITAAFGLSKISFKKFFTVAGIGFIIYSLAATNLGDYLAKMWF